MNTHELSVTNETDDLVLFTCIKCSKQIAFVKPGKGEPNPIEQNGTWLPAPNYMEYMDECSE